MNKYHLLSLLFFVSGGVLLALGVLSGEVETGIVIIFPFVIGSGLFALSGFICIFIGILFLMFSFLSTIEPGGLSLEYEEEHPGRRTSVKGGGVILIGPIPVVFGTNWKIALLLMILAIIIILILLFGLRVV
jgi:uncharacterized protein (TIGR00304 family)